MASTASDDGRDRRSTGLLRIPFVRRCRVDFAGSADLGALIVNLNVLGAYVARDDLTSARSGEADRLLDALPRLGERVTCRFRVPGRRSELAIGGVVSWLNPRQQHPVHSLPPGFGMKFEDLSDTDRAVIEGLVEDYLARSGRRP